MARRTLWVVGHAALGLAVYIDTLKNQLLRQEGREVIAATKELLSLRTTPGPSAERQPTAVTASSPSPSHGQSQLSKRDILKHMKSLLDRRIAEERDVSTAMDALGLDRLFAAKNFTTPNAIERDRRTLDRYRDLIRRTQESAKAFRNETDRLFLGQNIFAAERSVYEAKKAEGEALEQAVLEALTAQADAMSQLNEFVGVRWNRLTIQADGLHFEGPEDEREAKELAMAVDRHSEEIDRLAKQMQAADRAQMRKLEKWLERS